MELIQLKVFCSVAKYRSFTLAADNIFMSQSSVSKHISALENEIGEPLFNRTGKQIVLTDVGRDFSVYAEKILEIEESAQDYISTRKNAKNETICIGLEKEFTDASCTPAYNALIATIGMVHVQFPNLTISFRIAERSELDFLLQNRKIHFAVLTIDAAEVINGYTHNFRADLLHHNEYYLAYPISSTGGNAYTILEDAIFNIITLCFVPDTTNYRITTRLLSEYHISPVLRPCDSSIEKYLKIMSGESAGIIEDHALQFFSSCNMPVYSLPLSSSSICYSNYIVYNEFYTRSNPVMQDFLEYFKIHHKLNYRVDVLKTSFFLHP